MEEKVRYKQERTEGNPDGCYGNCERCHAEWGDFVERGDRQGGSERCQRRGVVILGGDVFEEKMRETVENWCYQPVWTPSYSEFSKTSSENSFRRAAEYVKLWAGQNVYFSLVVQDVTEAYIYAAGR